MQMSRSLLLLACLAITAEARPSSHGFESVVSGKEEVVPQWVLSMKTRLEAAEAEAEAAAERVWFAEAARMSSERELRAELEATKVKAAEATERWRLSEESRLTAQSPPAQPPHWRWRPRLATVVHWLAWAVLLACGAAYVMLDRLIARAVEAFLRRKLQYDISIAWISVRCPGFPGPLEIVIGGFKWRNAPAAAGEAAVRTPCFLSVKRARLCFCAASLREVVRRDAPLEVSELRFEVRSRREGRVGSACGGNVLPPCLLPRGEVSVLACRAA